MPRFLLLTKYAGPDDGTPMASWDPADITARLDFVGALNRELTESGELVDALALTGPELATTVTSDGVGVPLCTDGPFPEATELLAGYQIIDVESKARAIEIAAQLSAAPGPGGLPIRQPIEVRQVMGIPPGVDL